MFLRIVQLRETDKARNSTAPTDYDQALWHQNKQDKIQRAGKVDYPDQKGLELSKTNLPPPSRREGRPHHAVKYFLPASNNKKC